MKNTLFTLIVLLTFMACKKNDQIQVESITLDKSELSMHKSDKQTIKATIHPSNASDQHVTWLSSNETVATVSGGVVTALAAGEVQITATANGKSAICHIAVEPDIYAVGDERIDSQPEGPAYAIVWKNGTPTRLTDGTCYATAYCITQDGADLYIGGCEMNESNPTAGPMYARIWKNNKLVYQNNEKYSTISDIKISNGIRYAVGNLTEDNYERPTIWKDGVYDTLNCKGYDGGYAYAIQIVGSDIYVAGSVNIYDPDFGLLHKPTIWKNGAIYRIYEQEFGFILSLDIAPNGDIYASGYINSNATSLKNDTWLTLHEDGNAPNICLVGQDEYVTGYFFANNRAQGAIWKNGVLLYTMSAGDYACTLNQSQLWQNNIYTIGNVATANNNSVAKVWKNGKELHTLTDGTKTASSNAILIQE